MHHSSIETMYFAATTRISPSDTCADNYFTVEAAWLTDIEVTSQIPKTIQIKNPGLLALVSVPP